MIIAALTTFALRVSGILGCSSALHLRFEKPPATPNDTLTAVVQFHSGYFTFHRDRMGYFKFKTRVVPHLIELETPRGNSVRVWILNFRFMTGSQ